MIFRGKPYCMPCLRAPFVLRRSLYGPEGSAAPRTLAFLKRTGLLLAVIVWWYSTDAQNLTNQTTLYITEGLEVHLDGDVTSAGFIQNQGSIYVTGNWRNTNVYQGNGTLILSGDRAQTISNNTNAVYHLVVDGQGPKTINGKLPVTNRLDLSLGIINTTANDTLFLSQTAAIGGGSVESHVNGPLLYEGSGYRFFPVGKNGGYYPVDLLNITGVNPVTSLEVIENLPAINAPSAITLYPDVYWVRKSARGTFISSLVAIGYQIPDNYTNRHNLEIVQGDALDQPFSALGDVTVEYGDAVDKVVSSEALTGSVFALGESIPVDGIPGEFYFSTSLSPNAIEADNRFVRIFGNQLQANDFLFMVYNRWGLMVYENRSLEFMITKGWDGRHKGDGNMLPAGAYPFVLKAVKKTGEVIEQKGIISIVN